MKTEYGETMSVAELIAALDTSSKEVQAMLAADA